MEKQQKKIQNELQTSKKVHTYHHSSWTGSSNVMGPKSPSLNDNTILSSAAS